MSIKVNCKKCEREMEHLEGMVIFDSGTYHTYKCPKCGLIIETHDSVIRMDEVL